MPQAVTHSLLLLKMGGINAGNMLSCLELLINPIIVASSWCLYHLYQWWTVKQTSASLKTFTPQIWKTLSSIVDQEHYYLHSEMKRPQAQLDVTVCTLLHFMICSTCFGHFYAHHQELQLYMCTCRLWSAVHNPVHMILWTGVCTAHHRRQIHTYSLELLMMGIEVPETCWAYHNLQ